jgi:branched-subunit amino acid transport protein
MMDAAQHVYLIVATFGLCVVTAVTRSFFFLTPAKFQFSPRMQRALRYAPGAALAAVIAPSILLKDHALNLSVDNHTLLASLLATLVFSWRKDLLLMIATGMAAFTALRLLG